jgi:hypothetical protein
MRLATGITVADYRNSNLTTQRQQVMDRHLLALRAQLLY